MEDRILEASRFEKNNLLVTEPGKCPAFLFNKNPVAGQNAIQCGFYFQAMAKNFGFVKV